ncbi:MBOAT family O-acyltransferase [Paracoccus aestuariivivens]
MERTETQSARRFWLSVSLWTNLSVLGIFKYFNFFIESFAMLSEKFGFPVSYHALHIVLPVGISFYTFQTLSYTIDVYRRDIRATTSLRDFALFVSFFPQLVAGPIERASHLLPEVSHPRRMTWDNVTRGVVLCLIGLIKKIVIADAISPTVDTIFAMPDPSGGVILIGTWLFAIQIYCDFSGYTDIARGVARIMGFNLMLNFAQPYFSVNPQDFWRRWHISLSTWLRDYLYVPLGGNRKGKRRTQINLMLTMVLGGLWHGAAWNFVLWGAYQGTLLVLHRQLVGKLGARTDKGFGGMFLHIIKIALFFQVTCYGWLLFRASSFEQITRFTKSLLTMRWSDFSDLGFINIPVPAFAGMAVILFVDVMIEVTGNPRFYEVWLRPARAACYSILVYTLAFGATTTPSAFIYFQF